MIKLTVFKVIITSKKVRFLIFPEAWSAANRVEKRRIFLSTPQGKVKGGR